MPVNFAKRMEPRERVEENDRVDASVGFPFLEGNSKRLGWLTHFKTVAQFEDSTGRIVSCMDCYFHTMDVRHFKARLPFSPYFYAVAKENMLYEIESALHSKFKEKLKSVDRVVKEDLGLRNHLAGIKRQTLKLTFYNIGELVEVRNELMAIVRRNSDNKAGLVTKKSTEKMEQDAWDAIEDLREYDVQYHTRFSIDMNINCGSWYHVTVQQGQTRLQRMDDFVQKAEPKVCAFDIETTKKPLHFPNAEYDEIFMISYVFDGQGFLITNREVVSEDVKPFQYTPRKDYRGPFEVFNEKDEAATIHRFFKHMQEIQPSLYVTYNGDFFDWPFIEARALRHGMDMAKEIGFIMNKQNECLSRSTPHMDCLHWVNRDSYLPQGSRGLKAVSKAKLGYCPVEVDPEAMVRLAGTEPQRMASYSVSDAVATYYLYMKFIHPFIFSLSTIIPMSPDEVLRKGSGTLCESLLMVKAFKHNVLFPNKAKPKGFSFYKDHVLESETYIGGRVEACQCGLYRNDIGVQFNCTPSAYQRLIDKLDDDLKYGITVEGKKSLEDVENYDEVKQEIKNTLADLRDNPDRVEDPLIYHLDVAAMYPNIILTNRLQPTAVVSEEDCAACAFNAPNKQCLRKMNWVWRGECFAANRSDYNQVVSDLLAKEFPVKGKEEKKQWTQLSADEQRRQTIEQLKAHSRFNYKRMKLPPFLETKEAGICMRENSFYVDTVLEFRDRRYKYKGLVKKWKSEKSNANNTGDKAKASEAADMIILYDSLQLAHKCILNSFYGYVMRKGSRWSSMEMAGVVTHAGGQIIQRAKEEIVGLGQPLELDTDGIWCILPKSFPENYKFKCKDGSAHKVSYPCLILNKMVADTCTNDQYHTLKEGGYEKSNAMSIEFEVDGPYKAMILPASREEGKGIKKRYAVFDLDGSLAELKGFEVKRRGELMLIKEFQKEVFQQFLRGETLEQSYTFAANIANKYIDIIDTKGWGMPRQQMMQFVIESCTMSRDREEYGDRKSCAITCSNRLTELLQDAHTKEKGLTCRYIISKWPSSAKVSERAIPIEVFASWDENSFQIIQKWCGDEAKALRGRNTIVDIRDVIDWDYYLMRICNAIQKIITIPAAHQGLPNPVPRVPHPEWLQRKVNDQNPKNKQTRLTDMFSVKKKSGLPDMEDIVPDHMDAIPAPPPVQEIQEETVDLCGVPENGQPDTVQTENDDDRLPFSKKRKARWLRDRAKKKQKAKQTYRQVESGQSSSMWHVVQVEDSGQPGIAKVWALRDSRLFSFELAMAKDLYIATDKPDFEFGTKARRVLPPGVWEEHVRKISYSHDDYLKERFKLAVTLAGGGYVYGDRLPTWMSFAVHCGCTVSPPGKIGSQTAALRLNMEDIERSDSHASQYCAGPHHLGALSPLLVIYSHSKDNECGMYGVFCPASRSGRLIVLNRNAEPREPAPSHMLQSTWLNAVSKFEGGEMLMSDLGSVEILAQVVNDELAMEQAACAILRSIRTRSARPTVCLMNSSEPPSVMQEKLPPLNDIPCINLRDQTIQKDYGTVNWQRTVAKGTLEGCMDMLKRLEYRMEIAKYCNLPLGNAGTKPDMRGLDALFARSLTEGRYNHVLWAVDPSLRKEGFHRSWEAGEEGIIDIDIPEIVEPGCYRDICIELQLSHFELNAVLNAELLYQLENTHMLGTGQDTTARAVHSLAAMLAKAFPDAKDGNKVAMNLLKFFQGWIADPSSALYHPNLKARIELVYRKMLNRLVTEFQKLGIKVIKASPDSITVSTGRYNVQEAQELVKSDVELLEKNEVVGYLVMDPKRVWKSFVVYDMHNWGGIELVENDECLVPSERHQWALKNHLPPILQHVFVDWIGRFLLLHLEDDNIDEVSEMGIEASVKAGIGKMATEMEKVVSNYFLGYNLKDEATEFPEVPGMHLSKEERGSPPVALLRYVFHVFKLDNQNEEIEEAVHNVYLNMLTMAEVNDLDPAANFKDPCKSVMLRDIICRECGCASHVDVCRDISGLDGSEGSSHFAGMWKCRHCDEPLDKHAVHRKLLEHITKVNNQYNEQSLQCKKCGEFAQTSMFRYCQKCTGDLQPSVDAQSFKADINNLKQIAAFVGFSHGEGLCAYILDGHSEK